MTVVVVGAGLGGLSFGACAARDGHRVILIDKNAEPGGVMTLAREGGFSFEQGPLILAAPAGGLRRPRLAPKAA